MDHENNISWVISYFQNHLFAGFLFEEWHGKYKIVGLYLLSLKKTNTNFFVSVTDLIFMLIHQRIFFPTQL